MASKVLVGYSPNDFFYSDAQAQGIMPNEADCAGQFNPDSPINDWDNKCNPVNFPITTAIAYDCAIVANTVYILKPTSDIGSYNNLINSKVTGSNIDTGTTVKTVELSQALMLPGTTNNVTIPKITISKNPTSGAPNVYFDKLNFGNNTTNAEACIKKELCKNKSNVEKLMAIENGHSGSDEKYYNTKEQYNSLFMNTMNLGIGCIFLGVSIYLNR
jgi:hypothetical protein